MKRVHCISMACALAALLTSGAAWAQPQRSPDTPRTFPPDYDYGKQQVEGVGQLPGSQLESPRVDRRDAVDPFAMQGALLPTAHTPRRGTVTYRNHLFFGHQLSFAPRDRLMVSGLLVLSPDNLGFFTGNDHDLFAGLQLRGVLYRSRDLTVSIQPSFLMRSGQRELDTRTLAGQLAVMADYYTGDSVALSVGAIGHLPFAYRYTRADTSDCATRDDYAQGDCVQIVAEDGGRPQGGHWLVGYLGLTVYGPKHLKFKGELFTGANAGTILGVEGAVYNADDIDLQRDRYEEGELAFGLLQDGGAPIGLSLGVGWSRGGFGAQLSLVTLPGAAPNVDRRFEFFPHIFPMSTIGYAF